MGVDRDRLNRVEIQLTSLEEPIVVSWDTREQILYRLTTSQAAIGDAFRDVGASNPVMLSIDEEQQLLSLIEAWIDDVGSDQLRGDVFDLCNALLNDIRDAGRGP